METENTQTIERNKIPEELSLEEASRKFSEALDMLGAESVQQQDGSVVRTATADFQGSPTMIETTDPDGSRSFSLELFRGHKEQRVNPENKSWAEGDSVVRETYTQQGRVMWDRTEESNAFTCKNLHADIEWAVDELKPKSLMNRMLGRLASRHFMSKHDNRYQAR